MKANLNIDKIASHYAHARKKHPRFCDWVQPHGKTPEAVSKKIAFTLAKIRKHIKDNAKKHVLGWDDLLNCEVWEVFEALATGNKAQAVEELYDCIAILLRTIDVLEGRQSLDKPISGNPAGKTKRNNR